ncbi:hypothetical protein GCM10010405_35610 [Streptomyces macrosporus]|uniref:Uncharacterized protein n=1 Tax=Streptomyces macrosporus TaxID=44032 RepID=A0ABP5XCE7_9ACTN
MNGTGSSAGVAAGSRPPEAPGDGTPLVPADAVRPATTIVGGERFGDGRIARAAWHTFLMNR